MNNSEEKAILHRFKNSTRKTRHFFLRLSSYILAIFVFFAPFALAERLFKFLLNDPSINTVHQLCLRMPMNWAVDPSNWFRFVSRPTYLLVFLIGLLTFLVGPLFCGWLCSAGAVTEYLGKLVPDRFKLDLLGKINPTPVRYGFLIGFMITPFVSGSICCSFCNFSIFQNTISGLTGDWAAFSYWGSTTIITFFLWFLLFGLFMKGGRGWCNFACPIGAMLSLFYVLGSKLGFTYKLKYDNAKCLGCNNCVKACPMRSIIPNDKKVSVNKYNCITCLDCVAVCESKALTYGKGLTDSETVLTKPAKNETPVM